jgi:membrane associated rhomboid family serine protease
MLPIKDTIPSKNVPLGTWIIILANSLVFIFELMLPDSVLQAFFYYFGVVPARYSHPEWALMIGLPVDDYWPFVTSMFLHGGWLHIIGNMWTLWIFGDNVEDRMGAGRFLIFYFLCGIAAGVVHFVTNMNSTVPALGASGAIGGVLGAYLFLYPTARIIVLFPLFFLPIFFQLPAVTYLGYWILSQIFSGAISSLLLPEDGGGIAFWAHVGGFVAGAVLVRIFIKRRGRDRSLAPDEWGMEGAWQPLGSHGLRRERKWA